ncbi:MAG: hypothetical protein FWF59_09235 [Turicibacter sp.]|nr:hypothetical protein [Turicibacter sp.]
MLVSKSALRKKILRAWGFSVAISLIAVAVISLLGTETTTTVSALDRIFIGIWVMTLILLLQLPRIWQGFRYLVSQEKFYRFDFDEEVRGVRLKAPDYRMKVKGVNRLITSEFYVGDDWYISVDGHSLLAFKKGFATQIVSLSLNRRKHRAWINVLCLDGRVRRIRGNLGEVIRFCQWVDADWLEKQEMTESVNEMLRAINQMGPPKMINGRQNNKKSGENRRGK